MTNKDVYRFPECTLASNAPESTQCIYVLGEVHELLQAENEDCFDSVRILEETWDVIHAAEGVLRKYPTSLVKHIRNVVEEKNRKRGYYE